ncbi:hypothetical protein AB0K27_14965 [Micromonospora echinospora]|uniref:Integral membrane protein n=1 Tax=Micromonospora echinospora TaxID=1877 RepID=A0ABR6MH62_MICEC|nr:hypothetical protein [Micromonospora echinospora]MBB5114713.1 hypothetical protein [Micromonospora echinospora]
MSVAAVVATLVLTALAALQVLVAAGRPYGRLVWGGQHETLPRRLRIGSAVSVVVYAVIAWVLLARAEIFGPSRPFVGIATWVLFGYFAIGIALNAISRSRAERLVMTPACVVLAACSLTVALS